MILDKRIPKYLREIVYLKSIKEGGLTNVELALRCECGCKDFYAFKNRKKKFNISEKKASLIKETKKWENEYEKFVETFKYFREKIEYLNDKRIIKLFDSPQSYEQGKPVKIFEIKKGEVPLSFQEINQLTPQDFTKIYKAKCSDCEKEYTLFDSRIHGIDSVEDCYERLMEYEFEQLNKHKFKIDILIENPWDFNDIESNGNEGLTEDDYSILFSNIKITGKEKSGKKSTIINMDLG